MDFPLGALCMRMISFCRHTISSLCQKDDDKFEMIRTAFARTYLKQSVDKIKSISQHCNAKANHKYENELY